MNEVAQALAVTVPQWRAAYQREAPPRGEHWQVGALPEPSEEVAPAALPRRQRALA